MNWIEGFLLNTELMIALFCLLISPLGMVASVMSLLRKDKTMYKVHSFVLWILGLIVAWLLGANAMLSIGIFLSYLGISGFIQQYLLNKLQNWYNTTDENKHLEKQKIW